MLLLLLYSKSIFQAGFSSGLQNGMQNADQLELIAPPPCENGCIWEDQQMQITSMNLQIETLAAQVAELRGNQQLLDDIKQYVESLSPVR